MADALADAAAWRVVAAAASVHGLQAAANYIAPSTLLGPMQAELGVPLAAMTIPLSSYRVVTALFLLPAGLLLDRVGARAVLLPGVIAGALAGMLFPLARSVPQLAVLQAAAAFSNLLAGVTPMLMLFASLPRLRRRLGAATSAMLAGYSLAGALAPPVLGALTQHFGWRIAAGVFNSAFVLFGIPLAYFFLRGDNIQESETQPLLGGKQKGACTADVDLIVEPEPGCPSGMAPSQSLCNTEKPIAKEAPQDEERACTQRSAERPTPAGPLFTRGFTGLILAMAALAVSLNIVHDHLLVFLVEDVGLEFAVAAMYSAALNLSGLMSKVFLGAIADVTDKATLLLVFSVQAGLSCLLLLEFSVADVVSVTTSASRVLLFSVLCKLRHSICTLLSL